jgi:hypothetical protein
LVLPTLITVQDKSQEVHETESPEVQKEVVGYFLLVSLAQRKEKKRESQKFLNT